MDTGERILAEADKKNTALSTALINCALEGAADERIMDSLSFIAEGQGDIQEISNGIASYGNASGIDALTGMLAAILNQYFIGRKPK